MTQTKAKIEGKFYPLTAEELIYLCQILTDAELKTLLYLKSIHPFTDSYKELDTSAIAEHLNISRRSIQRFLKKFKQLNLIEWEITKFKYKPLQIVTTAGSPKRQQDRFDDTGIAETTAGSLQRQQDRLETLEPLSNKDCETLQTIQTFQTLQTEGEGSFFENENASLTEDDSSTQRLTGLGSILNNGLPVKTENRKEDKVTPDCSTKKVEQSTPSKVANTNFRESDNHGSNSASVNPNIDHLTPELRTKLEDLNIPLDEAVKKAIASYHPSQIWGALNHIEECSDEIRSPRAIFLYQVPKQVKDERKLPKERFTPEFLEWYQDAITRGLVINRPIESLGLYQFIEPMVQLPNGSQWPWTKVRDGQAEIKKDIPFNSVCNIQKIKEMAEKARQARSNKLNKEN